MMMHQLQDEGPHPPQYGSAILLAVAVCWASLIGLGQLAWQAIGALIALLA